jgi:putative transposase
MVRWFGEVQSARMILNENGIIAQDEWKKSAIIRPGISVDNFIIMPNHVHGIVVIKDSLAATHSCASLQRQNVFGPQRKNLASIVRGFKATVTRRIHERGSNDFEWQSRYHDLIIRNRAQLNAVQNYIRNNPAQWNEKEDTSSDISDWLD